MIVGVPTEIKTHEYRVALTPAAAREVVERGHEVLLQAGAGVGSGHADEDYAAQGARIVPNAEDVFETAEMILKVKEPQPAEVAMLSPGQVLFTYLHLAASKDLTVSLQESGAIGIAYETVELSDGSLPLLAPMSEIAGRMATQVGAYFLEKAEGGRGILLGGIPGVMPAKVVVVGAGMAGANAAVIAMGMQARVVALDRSAEKLRRLNSLYLGHIMTLSSNRLTLEEQVLDADLVVGAALIPGAAAPKLVTEDMIRSMRPGSVVVDISIDQGGCFETSRPTSHDDPVYEAHGVVHYAVTNIPGAVPHTSTYGLTNATLPYILQIADLGVEGAVTANRAIRSGLNVANGAVVHAAVADSLGLEHHTVADVLGF
ncbi:MAG: alanine dehydrogenase [Acidimicrobiia bacterium]|nr:alanine dehydrogenase [Acidimicrobiia bacterium]MBT8217354.1 alanine dehydrogenase [Acidimicrobiia bacterium]NNF10190.1 alanine dehydrogenase [Acidimicrobiia bacterium]NNL69086.1 alanine dehydrogenase [Acidimicrobiia bacterium]